jgi:hypothetical protein
MGKNKGKKGAAFIIRVYLGGGGAVFYMYTTMETRCGLVSQEYPQRLLEIN